MLLHFSTLYAWIEEKGLKHNLLVSFSRITFHLLQLVVVYNILVCWTRLSERIQMIHVVHVAPKIRQISWNVEIHKVFA
jgi:hypothetical protein